MKRIADGIAVLDLPAMRGGFVHPTLLWEGERAILVDAGFPGQVDVIRAEVEQAGVSFDRLTEVIITHHDLDHIGSLSALKTALPKAHILCGELEKPFVQGDQLASKLAIQEVNLANMTEEEKDGFEDRKAGFYKSVAPVDETLADGQELPLLGGVRIVYTIGHTPGHICLYLPAHKLLIAGDAARVEEGRLVRMMPQMNADTPKSIEALGVLAKLDVTQAICYHGGYVQGDLTARIGELAHG